MVRRSKRPSTPKSSAKGPASLAYSEHALRITGGHWRGRAIRFPLLNGLRPTLSQPRERLFNWLQFDLAGRRVLDAFAGSGILGLEALSRGAAHCDFVERDASAAGAIRQHLATLEATNGRVHQADVFTWLSQSRDMAFVPYDVVFLDPPFSAELFHQAMTAVVDSGCVRAGGRVYLEAPKGFVPAWPNGWQAEKAAQKGSLQQWLCRTPTPNDEDTL